MSIDAEILPVSHVEELVRNIVKALRAFQMYMPNNPMYQRAEFQLRESFPPVWAVLDEITLFVRETDLIWEEHPVYEQPSKNESFAWGLYKDGMRVLTLRKGVEEGEFGRFLQTVTRARHLSADASDDLLTLLWEQDFQKVTYQFAEVISDPWVYDPQALDLQAQKSETLVQEQVRQEVQSAKPEGMVDLDDFDSTLYFLDEVEIAALRGQVEEEYVRDTRIAALSVLFDIFELQEDPDTRAEIVGVLETLFPNLLIRGDFHTLATILRELRSLKDGKNVDQGALQRVEAFEGRLSQPETIAQLLQSLDEAATLPPEDELGEVLRELRAPALGTILNQLPRLASAVVKTTIATAAERLAMANSAELLRLLRNLEPDALPGAVRLAGRLGLQAAVLPVGELVRHDSNEVRLASVEVLATLGTPGAMTALEPAIDDTDRQVRVAAVTAVSKRAWAGGLRRLEAAVQGKGPARERSEQRQVFEAYASVAGPPALETLRGLLVPKGMFQRKSSTEVRTCAVYALGKLRTAEARMLVEDVQNDKELPVRHAATSLLREWPG
ncbi:MAG TPA: HEAT repeat domain-containing protein [Gemmatimonadales bacterium]|nr:HEAT repeat domain-containing protein [Gemmatimonadales bacterium]